MLQPISIHQLRPETSTAMAPFTVNHTARAQQAAKLPVYSMQYESVTCWFTLRSHEIVAGYLDLTAAEITRKYDAIASQREALGLPALGSIDKPLLSVQEKQVHEKQSGNDDPVTYGEFEQVFAFRDSNLQNWFKDETCTYYNKKGHTETVCFSMHEDDKMTKMAKTVSDAKAE